jgi:DNA-binding MarR family transcriptional regulator
MREYNNLPLFSEHARKDDPQASHDRAAKLNKSIELTDNILLVLLYVKNHPGRTAKDIGSKIFFDTLNTDHLCYAWKVASRLEDVGYITRKSSPYRLTITEVGKKILKGAVK